MTTDILRGLTVEAWDRDTIYTVSDHDLATRPPEALATEYLAMQRSHSQLFGHQAKKWQRQIGTELYLRGYTHIGNAPFKDIEIQNREIFPDPDEAQRHAIAAHVLRAQHAAIVEAAIAYVIADNHTSFDLATIRKAGNAYNALTAAVCAVSPEAAAARIARQALVAEVSDGELA